MDEVWKRIKRWFYKNVTPDCFLEIADGANIEEIRNTEDSIGLTFPDALTSSYLCTNGIDGVCFYRNYELLSLNRIVHYWTTRKELLIQGYLGDPASPIGPIRNVTWSVSWIPIMDTGSGDHIIVDMDPTKGGTVGQLVEYNHEVGPVRDIASGFGKWLTSFADDLEAGTYQFYLEMVIPRDEVI